MRTYILAVAGLPGVRALLAFHLALGGRAFFRLGAAARNTKTGFGMFNRDSYFVKSTVLRIEEHFVLVI